MLEFWNHGLVRSPKIWMVVVCDGQPYVSTCLAMGCPVIRLHIILGIPVKVFLDEMNI